MRVHIQVRCVVRAIGRAFRRTTILSGEKMIIPFCNNEKTEWHIKGANCGDGVYGLSVSFSTHTTWFCRRAVIYADGEPVGCAMLANSGEVDTAVFPTELMRGSCDICIRIDGAVEILGVELIHDKALLRDGGNNGSTASCAGGSSITDSGASADGGRFTNTMSSTWEAVDMLGRHVTSAEDAGERREGKRVGIFYWTWRDAHRDRRPINLTALLAEHPEAEFDPEHPAWGADDNLQCHWNEPRMGFYLNSDPYVLRKHAVMLADAEIDFIVFDCTNGDFLWKDGYEPLLREFAKAREEGIKAPQVAFMLNFAAMEPSERMLRALYQDIYRRGRYEDLWFKIDGKPLIMAYPDSLPKEGVCASDTSLLDEIRDFFAFRPGQPLYYGGPFGPYKSSQWGWLEMAPQHKYCEREDSTCEMMTVGVAQNARDGRICTYFNDEGTYGRSYTKADGHSRLDSESYKYGYNFEEQWENALKADPDIIFITGWNEWQMGRCHENWVLDENSKQIAFVDQYDREHSRDIEPDIDGYLDTYYLQMISYIRKFKGAQRRTAPSPEVSVDIHAGKSEWSEICPCYESTCGAVDRDYDGYGGIHYTNSSARNRIMRSRVARDGERIYFYVECREALRDIESERGLVLYLDTDRNKSTGWEGYDHRVIFRGGEGVLQRCIGGFEWADVCPADAHIGEDYAVVTVRRADAGLCGRLDFEFKWSDNMQSPEAIDFYYNGDCAPHGRFNYLFTE